jgi:hypothetical protein
MSAFIRVYPRPMIRNNWLIKEILIRVFRVHPRPNKNIRVQ